MQTQASNRWDYTSRPVFEASTLDVALAIRARAACGVCALVDRATFRRTDAGEELLHSYIAIQYRDLVTRHEPYSALPTGGPSRAESQR
jgi:hypothetical protein